MLIAQYTVLLWESYTTSPSMTVECKWIGK